MAAINRWFERHNLPPIDAAPVHGVPLPIATAAPAPAPPAPPARPEPEYLCRCGATFKGDGRASAFVDEGLCALCYTYERQHRSLRPAYLFPGAITHCANCSDVIRRNDGTAKDANH